MNKNVNILHQLLETKFADPVSALALSDKYIVYGTMMGRILLMGLENKKIILLAELSSENITGITFENENTFNIAVGDDEVVKYKFDTNNINAAPDYLRLKNYETDGAHKSKCDSCFTLLSDQYLLLVYMSQNQEEGISISIQKIVLRVKNVWTNEMDETEVEMSNYSVPFDFDGNKFVFIEYLNDKDRNFSCFYLDTGNKYFFKLDQSFGHISHCKLLPGNKVFIVRKLNLCEIRILDESFSLTHSFLHIGDEVIAVDFYINNKYVINEFGGGTDQIIVKKEDSIKKDKNELQNINHDAIISNNFNEDNLTLGLVDIDGNLNIYENYIISKRFNLYDLKDIADDYKQKQFFSMGYPYYLKINNLFFAISTDHGVFIIRKNID